MNINSMNGEAVNARRRYTKSQLAYALFNTHRPDALYRIVDEELLESVGWTIERYKKIRGGGIPPLLIDKILAEEGLTWQELNAKMV